MGEGGKGTKEGGFKAIGERGGYLTSYQEVWGGGQQFNVHFKSVPLLKVGKRVRTI